MSSTNSIKCTLCLKLLEDPYTLPCGHHLCHVCIDRAVDLQKAIDVIKGVPAKKPKEEPPKDGEAPSERVFLCPSCGKKCAAEKCRPNEELRHIVALEKEMQKKRMDSGNIALSQSSSGGKEDVCGFCGKPAEIYCCFCGALCKEHSDFLHVTGPMKSHDLSSRPRSVLEAAFSTPVTPAKMGEKDRCTTMPLCSDHEQVLGLYCRKCKVLVCAACAAFGSHRGHDAVECWDVYKEQREKLRTLVKAIEEKGPECDTLAGSYERLAKNADTDRFSATVNVRREFKALRGMIDEREKAAEEAIQETYAQFRTALEERMKATTVLKAEAARLIAASKEKLAAFSSDDGKAPRFDMSMYSLVQSLEKVQEAINYLSLLKPPEKDGVCRVTFASTPKDLLHSYVTVSCPFLGSGRGFVPINFEKLRTVSNINAFPANHDSTHDGGAIIDPQRRLVVAYCGSYNSGRTLLVTKLPDVGFEGATTETRERVVPFGVHGQYPVFDGKQYVYFFQSEDGSNDRIARMDLETFTFHEFSRHPDRFQEYSSGCVVGNRVFIIDSDRRLSYLDVEADSWTRTDLHIDGRARLLSNPNDDKHIYSVCTDGHVYIIDIGNFTSSQLCDIPGSYSLDANNEALLVPTGTDSFAIFCYTRDRFQAYDSVSGSWTALNNVRYSRGGGGHLICDTKCGNLYYHSGSKSTWDAIPLL